MAVSLKTKELIDRFIKNITSYPNCDMRELGNDIYSIVDWSLRNHLKGPMAQYKEDIRQDCALAIWRKISEGKVKYVDRRILGFLQLVTVNMMRNKVKQLSNRVNMLNTVEYLDNIGKRLEFSLLLCD